MTQLKPYVENIENLPKSKSRLIRAERKLKRNSGKSYITESGKEVPERKIVQLGNCRSKCAEKISQEHIQNTCSLNIGKCKIEIE